MTPPLCLTDVGAKLVPEPTQLLFFGTYKCAVDRNGRMTVPADFRSRLHIAGVEEIGVFLNADRSRIKVYPLQREPGVSKSQRAFVGLIGTDVVMIATFKLGQRGHIRLPSSFLAAADIVDTAFVVGRGWGFDIVHKWPCRDIEPGTLEPILCGKYVELIT